MATHSSVLAWRIPGMGGLVGCRLWGLTESDTTGATQQQQQQHCVIFRKPFIYHKTSLILYLQICFNKANFSDTHQILDTLQMFLKIYISPNYEKLHCIKIKIVSYKLNTYNQSLLIFLHCIIIKSTFIRFSYSGKQKRY